MNTVAVTLPKSQTTKEIRMSRNTLASSLVLLIAFLSVSLSAKATPPDPKPPTPPLVIGY